MAAKTGLDNSLKSMEIGEAQAKKEYAVQIPNSNVTLLGTQTNLTDTKKVNQLLAAWSDSMSAGQRYLSQPQAVEARRVYARAVTDTGIRVIKSS